jgi:hypothetical protein
VDRPGETLALDHDAGRRRDALERRVDPLRDRAGIRWAGRLVRSRFQPFDPVVPDDQHAGHVGVAPGVRCRAAGDHRDDGDAAGERRERLPGPLGEARVGRVADDRAHSAVEIGQQA